MENNNNAIEAWESFLSIVKQILEPQQFQTWFVPIKPVSLVDSTMTIQVPSDYFRNYIEDAYLQIISATLKRVIGPKAKLIYTNKIADQSISTPGSKYVRTENEASISLPTSNCNVYSIPGVIPNKMKINSQLNPLYSFDNMVMGDCNKMGMTIGKEIALYPGKSFSPYFIFGGSGLGKTHLAHAIGLAVKEKHPEMSVLYVTANEFKNQYVTAVSVQNKLADFIAFYKRIDVLIVDDIQDLSGPGTQNAFFNIFNHLHQYGKQLIFTSDRAPKDLQNFEERLLSRFKWGLSVRLTQPDYQTRLDMLKSRAQRESLIVPENVFEYIAKTVRNSFRELEGTLISLMAHASVERNRSYMDIASSITENLVDNRKAEFNIEKVQQTVCEYFNISVEDILSRSRKRNIVQARQIAMYLCRNLISNCSLSTIGAEIGGKDHATVLHACMTVGDLMQTDKVFKKYVTDIEGELMASRS